MVIGETFEEAGHMLSEHLRNQGKPDHLVWIFQEDITGFSHPTFFGYSSLIKLPSSKFVVSPP
jgi:hypothetical protein